MKDIFTDNEDNLEIENEDMLMYESDGVNIIALRNYLRMNKHTILKNITSNANYVFSLILQKAIDYNLNPSLIRIDEQALKSGNLKAAVTISKAQN